ncbi:hypothetical protein PV327_006846 [Microctonus hyperodae]|uniref:Odorant receptor n=1 Tax=Microctonus hyperodae TaxID=165561 RepID=A0AA39F587_MICHY|nr:hypothetical protein PV327_006846 [Microctonus hyperodae]
MFEVTPETAFAFTKLSVNLVLSWPPNKTASKREIIIFHIKWWMLWFNSIFLVIPLIYAAYNDRRDTLLLTKSLCLAVSCSQATIKMLICKIMHNRMQFVIEEMECYVRNAEIDERELFLRHTKNCGFLHVSFIGASLLASIGVILGPLVLPQSLPTEAKYPFSVEEHPVLEIIYVQQSIAGIQVASIGAIDCQIAMMSWNIIIRLKYLGRQMTNIGNLEEFSLYIQKHQYILQLSQEVIFISRYIILTTVIMTTLSIVFGAVHIIGDQPITVKIQFTIVVLGFCGLLYINAWPSEILIRSCQNIGSAIYESDWAKINYNKDIIFVIQRTRIPEVISIPGFLPELSLSYYTSALSFFTTLRMIMMKLESTVTITSNLPDENLN